MRSDTLARVFVLGFVCAFFVYLFGPLIIMGVTAFNSSQFPRVTPFECFSVEWFEVLVNDEKLMRGLRNSLIIGAGVVLLAVPLGLAGALMLTQVPNRLRPWYYTIVIAPILIPGVVLGISTLVFWDRLGRMFGAGEESIFYDGIFLTIIGQATFVSAYAMLIFISRLQRFDPAQEEAALDLGATHVQTFRKVLLPFLKPAIGSAAVLAFLASFENYNTTVFTALTSETLITVLASKVRYGINPSISALAVIIVALTLFGAVIYEIMKRREAAAERESARIARGEIETRAKRATLIADPALIVFILICVAGLGTVYFAGTMGVEECKAQVKAEKKRTTEQRVRERRTLQMFKGAAPGEETGQGAAPAAPAQPAVKAKGTEGYTNIFAPQNLEGQVGTGDGTQGQDADAPARGTEGYTNIFAPQNLEGQVGVGDGAQAPDPDAPAKGTEGYTNIFAPQNARRSGQASDPESRARRRRSRFDGFPTGTGQLGTARRRPPAWGSALPRRGEHLRRALHRNPLPHHAPPGSRREPHPARDMADHRFILQ